MSIGSSADYGTPGHAVIIIVMYVTKIKIKIDDFLPLSNNLCF